MQPQAQSAGIEGDVEAARASLDAFLAEWVEAMHAEDAEALATMFTDDAVMLPPNRPPIVGNAAIRQDIQEYFDKFTPKGTEEYTAYHVSCDFMIALGSWQYEDNPKAGGEAINSSGYMMDIFKRQPDGSWKLYWNASTDETLVNPNQPKE